MAELLPPADNREAIVSMWSRLGSMEEQQRRFEAALEVLRGDIARGHEQNENHLTAQDATLADIRERQAGRAAKWPDAAKAFVSAVAGAVIAVLAQLAAHGRL